MVTMEPFFESVLQAALQSLFLQKVAGKYHYSKEMYPVLQTVIVEVVKKARKEAAWQWIPYEDDLECKQFTVLMTLGREIDRLQEEYLKEGMLSEAYMAEVVASEILLRGYEAFNKWVAKEGFGYVERYFFFGSEENFPLDSIPKFLKNFRLSVTCNEAYCMIPKKSVMFVAKLSENPATICPGICVGCDSKNCPNRIHKNWKSQLSNMPDGPLSYGYARIFGK